MSSLKRISILAMTALFAALLSAAPVSAQTQNQEQGVTAATPAQIGQVLAANTFTHSNVFIAVCGSQASSCKEFQDGFKLSSALVRGGWSAGVQNMHSSEFYTLDATAANTASLSRICAAQQQPSAAAKASCQAVQTALSAARLGPQIVMFNRMTGKLETASGLSNQAAQTQAISKFLKK
jgi:hypothetical protein